jgi:hypothetical protein
MTCIKPMILGPQIQQLNHSIIMNPLGSFVDVGITSLDTLTSRHRHPSTEELTIYTAIIVRARCSPFYSLVENRNTI